MLEAGNLLLDREGVVMVLSKENRAALDVKISRVFRPASPIDNAKLFAGRKEQFRRLLDAISSQGQHAVIYGERGVGKTSLVNVIADILMESDSERKVYAPKINCDGTDNYSSVWKKILSEFTVQESKRKVGFLGALDIYSKTLADDFQGREITPADVKTILSNIGKRITLIPIIDEFDRLPNGNNHRLFADTIKLLSDYSVPATIVLVGVADNVNELIVGHQSAERAIVQIPLTRMSHEELLLIIENGLNEVEMEMDAAAKNTIANISQGLPHYTHLLALYSARKALDADETLISLSHLDAAINEALINAQQSIISSYLKAIASSRKDHLFKEVLLACALAKKDALGFFQAADVREPMSRIMNKSFDIPAFSRHLNDFADDDRGPVLSKDGKARRYKFRFKNPLMQPYIILQGLQEQLISHDYLSGI